MYNVEMIPLVTCCILHNICIENDEFIDDAFEVDVQDNIVFMNREKKRHYFSYVAKLSL